MAQNSGNFSWDSIWKDEKDDDQFSLYLANANVTSQFSSNEVVHKDPYTEVKRSVSDSASSASRPTYISDLYTAPLQIPNSLDDRLFCTPDTISSCGKYINQRLSDYGLSTLHGIPLPLKLELPLQASDLSTIINCLFVLLQSHQKGIEMKDEYNTKIRRITTDRENLAEQKKKLQEKIESLESDLKTQAAKERSVHELMKKQKEKFEYDKEELLKKVSNLSFRDSQYQHEMKKKELAYDKLKDKMNTLLSDFNNKNSKNSNSSYGMDSSTKALRTASLDSATPVNTGMIQMSVHKMMIESYEEKSHALVEENNLLRNSLIELKSELSTIQHSKSTPSLSFISLPIEKSPSLPSTQDLDSKNIHLPFSMVKEDIESSFKQKIESIRERIAKIYQENLLKETDNPEFRTCIDEMKKIIDEQDELLRIAVTIPTSRSESILNESQIAEIEEDRKALAQLREELESQRQQIADESVKLLQERLLFEKEKLKSKETEEINISQILPSPMISTPFKLDDEDEEGLHFLHTPITKINKDSNFASPPPSKIKPPSSAPRSNRKTWTLPSTPIQLPKTENDDDSDKENKNNPV